MLACLKRFLAALWGKTQSPVAIRVTAPGAHITRVSVDAAKCLAHEWCVHVCPEVSEFRDGSAHVRSEASKYFVSKKAEILRAEAECPVEAIKVDVDDA
jgi:ferredoxin